MPGKQQESYQPFRPTHCIPPQAWTLTDEVPSHFAASCSSSGGALVHRQDPSWACNSSTLGESSSVAAQSSAGDDPGLATCEGQREESHRRRRRSATSLLSRAQLWRAPSTPIEQVNFATDPRAPEEIRCRFTVSELGGTAPKFDCTLENGEPIRVKYGKTGEVPGEVASTRLLRALGFGADHVSFVPKAALLRLP